MIKTIRQILLTEYIGAILIALLACQAVIVLATSVVRDLLWYFYDSRDAGVLAYTRRPFRWDNFVFSVTSAALYLLLAYFLARWLYPATSQSTEAERPPDESEQL